MKKFIVIALVSLGVQLSASAQYFGGFSASVWSDPCVQASIAAANSYSRIMQTDMMLLAQQAQLMAMYPNAYMTTPVYPSTTYESTTSSNESSSYSYENRYGDVDCHICGGSGVCPTCNGKGWYYSEFGTGTIKCPNCAHDHPGKCGRCFGTGKVYGLK